MGPVFSGAFASGASFGRKPQSWRSRQTDNKPDNPTSGLLSVFRRSIHAQTSYARCIYGACGRQIPGLAQEPTTPSAPTPVAGTTATTTATLPETTGNASSTRAARWWLRRLRESSQPGQEKVAAVLVRSRFLARARAWRSAAALRDDEPSRYAAPAAGVLGNAATTVLVGNQNVNTGAGSGFRIGTGYWCTPEQIFGIEADFFFLGAAEASRSPAMALQSWPDPSWTSRPAPSRRPWWPSPALRVARSRSRITRTSGVMTSTCVRTCGAALGISWTSTSWLSLYALRIIDHHKTRNQPTACSSGTNISVADNFVTHNIFNGADLGMHSEIYNDMFSLGLLAKVGVGVTEHTVNINGSTTTTAPANAPVINGGGLLALSSNIGHHSAYDYGAVRTGGQPGLAGHPEHAGDPRLRCFVVVQRGPARRASEPECESQGLIRPRPAGTTTPATPTLTGQKDW